WQALNERQKYEENRNDLWSTQRVIETMATAFKNIRMTSMMMVDTVEQEQTLTPGQREVIQRVVDGFLDSTHTALVQQWQNYVPPNDEHGKPPSESAMLISTGPDAEFDDGFGDLDA
ncbi:MAG TPA: hypothetical protein VGB05_01685, partial [Pyrinomonadaceae bacterium]